MGIKSEVKPLEASLSLEVKERREEMKRRTRLEEWKCRWSEGDSMSKKEKKQTF